MDELIGTLNNIKEDLSKNINFLTFDQAIDYKVFLGGTCAGEDYRKDLIPMLNIPYFNPVVENWTPADQENEEKEKIICGIHLYVITPAMKGVFSIAEAVNSSLTPTKNTVFCILDKTKFEEKVLKSLEATEELLKRNGAIIANNLNDVAEVLNRFVNSMGEDFAGTTQAMSPTPITSVGMTKYKYGKSKIKKEDSKNNNERELK